MKIFIDNNIARILRAEPSKIAQLPFLNPENPLILLWPTFLGYLTLESVLTELPPFEPTQQLFQACLTALSTYEEEATIYEMYDRLFTENLRQIQALPAINAEYLLQAIKERKTLLVEEKDIILLNALDDYEIKLSKSPSLTMHELILYLAWEQICLQMAVLFDYQSRNAKFIQGLDILKGCLLESYSHITQQEKIPLSIYRLFEAFFFIQMREENLQLHSDAEWAILNKSFKAIKTPDEVADVSYIDNGVVYTESLQPGKTPSECYLTLIPETTLGIRLSFAQFMMKKIQAEFPQWNYSLQEKEVKSLSEMF